MRAASDPHPHLGLRSGPDADPRRTFCDLHCHSTASDGSDSPAALPRLAREAGLRTLALTDHDTVAGLADAAAAAGTAGIRFIPGIELSVSPDLRGRATADRPPRGTLHLLGYFVDPEHGGLLDLCADLRADRAARNPAILERLAGLGVRLSMDDVHAAAGSGGDPAAAVIGRPHIAQALVDRGYVRSVHEAFHRYLGAGGAAFVRRDGLAADRAIDVLHDAGAVVVLAHPPQLKLSPPELEQAVAHLTDLGLDGIEVYHPDLDPAMTRQCLGLAERFRLCPTGGSDYHGSRKSNTLNQCGVPDTVADALAAYASGTSASAGAGTGPGLGQDPDQGKPR